MAPVTQASINRYRVPQLLGAGPKFNQLGSVFSKSRRNAFSWGVPSDYIVGTPRFNMVTSAGPTLAYIASLCWSFTRNLSIQLVNLGLKSGRCVGIAFGISSLLLKNF